MNSLVGIDMGRILLDLSNEVIKQLDDLEVQRNLPRADLLREAVDQYLINQSQTARTSVPGIWQGCEGATFSCPEITDNVRVVHAGCGVNALSGLQSHANSIY